MRSEPGVSLIELLLAVAIVSAVVAMMTIFFPKASQSIVNNRQHWAAVNFGVSKIEESKKQPYAYIDPTPDAVFAGLTPPNVGCDCTLVTPAQFTNWPPSLTEVITSTGTNYTRYTCVNFVSFALGGQANSSCIAAGDTGAKYVRVRVSWATGSNNNAVDQESVIARN